MTAPLELLRLIIEAHGKQTRRDSGLPYVIHLVRTAQNVVRYYEEYASACTSAWRQEALIDAALGHDLLEDTSVAESDLNRLLGFAAASVVMEVTTDALECKRIGKGPYLTAKMAKMSHEALFIKLCDRLDNVTDCLESCGKRGSLSVRENQTVSDTRMMLAQFSDSSAFPTLRAEILTHCNVLEAFPLEQAEAFISSHAC